MSREREMELRMIGHICQWQLHSLPTVGGYDALGT